MPEFYMISARKISKIPDFLQYFFRKKNKQNSVILHDFCTKNARILRNNCLKNIFHKFYGGTCRPPLSPRLLCLWVQPCNCELWTMTYIAAMLCYDV